MYIPVKEETSKPAHSYYWTVVNQTDETIFCYCLSKRDSLMISLFLNNAEIIYKFLKFLKKK